MNKKKTGMEVMIALSSVFKDSDYIFNIRDCNIELEGKVFNIHPIPEKERFMKFEKSTEEFTCPQGYPSCINCGGCENSDKETD